MALFARQYNLKILIDTYLNGEMFLNNLVHACPLGHHSVYPGMAVFFSPDKAAILHLLQELANVSLYNVNCGPIKLGPDSRLVCVPFAEFSNDDVHGTMVQSQKEKCSVNMHLSLARILCLHSVSAERIMTVLSEVLVE